MKQHSSFKSKTCSSIEEPTILLVLVGVHMFSNFFLAKKFENNDIVVVLCSVKMYRAMGTIHAYVRMYTRMYII